MHISGFFTASPDNADLLIPTKYALGRWAKGTLHGPAVCGIAARALENAFGAEGLFPARCTIDMFKAAHDVPTHTVTRLIRDGRRIRVGEVDVVQGDSIVARASIVLFRPSTPPPGEEWSPTYSFSPPLDLPEPKFRYLGSDDGGWSEDIAGHQNASRKRNWTKPIPVVENEPTSPFVKTVVAAEVTSLLTNLGTDGIGYINADLTVALSRLPHGTMIGIEADSHIVDSGMAVGTATLYDEIGPIGTGLITALNNSAAQIDFAQPAINSEK